MPLGKDVGKNIKELRKDNARSGKERGAGGKPRSQKQILAIALDAARRAGAKVKQKPRSARAKKRSQ